MATILKVLQFLRLADENGQISLTNVAVMVVLYKVVTVQTNSMTDVGALLVTLLGYAYKRHVTTKSADLDQQFTDQINAVEQRVVDVKTAFEQRVSDFTKDVLSDTAAVDAKLAELKSQMSKLNLAQAFSRTPNDNH